ncbi:uncharacterized protein LOC120187957 [Hibiscus syriacus]|uniref:uncharacterized protein LOC120187957 n=1 Tax=Hibiscus syriacus TaxID=106335 RepID=UPI00192400F7|nr:uncharacterized protein LOC120187957 [Hibiscus syriacus]
MKILEKELKAWEAKAREMRREVEHMKLGDRESKAKLITLELINAETREANRQASIDNARNQLLVQAMLPLFHGNCDFLFQSKNCFSCQRFSRCKMTNDFFFFFHFILQIKF